MNEGSSNCRAFQLFPLEGYKHAVEMDDFIIVPLLLHLDVRRLYYQNGVLPLYMYLNFPASAVYSVG